MLRIMEKIEFVLNLIIEFIKINKNHCGISLIIEFLKAFTLAAFDVKILLNYFLGRLYKREDYIRCFTNY